MKILQLPPYFEPEQIASTSISKALRNAYIHAGFEIEIYAPTPCRGIDDKVREKYLKIPYEEQYDGKMIIHRFKLFKEGKNPVLRAFRYITENIIQYYKGKKSKDVSVIVAGSTPPTQGIMCGLLKKKLKVPFVYNLQDIFPDSMIDTKLTHEGSLLWKIGRKIEDYTYRSADEIIVISEGFKKNIMKKGVPEDKITVICNWPDDTNVHPVEKKDNPLFDRFQIPRDKFIVCYSGSIQMTQNWELLIDVAEDLKQNDDLLFVIIGEGDAKSGLETQVKDKDLYNIRLLPYMPREELNYVFSLGDAGLIISRPNTGSSAVPSKTWNIMMAGRPVIASFDIESELCELINKINCGLTSDAGKKEDLEKIILYALHNQELLNLYGKNGKDYVTKYLNPEICTGKYVNVIMRAINNVSGKEQ